MSESLALIVDPNPLRRQKIQEYWDETGAGALLVAATLSQAQLLAMRHMPSRVAVAQELSVYEQCDELVASLTEAGAEVLIFDQKRAPAGGEAEGPSEAERLRKFVAIFGQDLPPRPERARFLSGEGAGLIGSTLNGEHAATGAHGVRSLIVIGASTGGVAALEEVLSQFPRNCPPTLIVQHMRPGFGEGLIRRLDAIAAPSVMPAGDRVLLENGTVHVAAGNGRHLGVVRRGGLMTRLLGEDCVSGHCPSVDILFQEATALVEHVSVSAVLLTGMGADGAEGMCKLRAAGAYTIAQDQGSSVVWGMPRVAVEMGGAEEVLALSRIAAAVLRGPERQRRATGRVTMSGSGE